MVVGPDTVVVTVAAGIETVSIPRDTVVVTDGPGTVVVARLGTVMNVVVGGVVRVPLGARVCVTVTCPSVVVSVTMRVSPGSVRALGGFHTASWSALPTAPCAIAPIEATPTM